MPGMEVGYDLNPEMRLWVSPSLIEANYILSLSRMELQEVIEQELEENPALEMEEKQVCPNMRRSDGRILLPQLLGDSEGRRARTMNRSRTIQSSCTLRRSAPSRSDSDEFDPMTLVASEQTLEQQILSDVSTLCQNGDLACR